MILLIALALAAAAPEAKIVGPIRSLPSPVPGRQPTRSSARRSTDRPRRARELYDQMLKLHPLRMNVNALWTSARVIKG